MGMFTAGVVMAQILGLLFILTIGIWMGHFQVRTFHLNFNVSFSEVAQA